MRRTKAENDGNLIMKMQVDSGALRSRPLMGTCYHERRLSSGCIMRASLATQTERLPGSSVHFDTGRAPETPADVDDLSGTGAATTRSMRSRTADDWQGSRQPNVAWQHGELRPGQARRSSATRSRTGTDGQRLIRYQLGRLVQLQRQPTSPRTRLGTRSGLGHASPSTDFRRTSTVSPIIRAS